MKLIKQIFYVLMVLCLLLSFSACEKPEKTELKGLSFYDEEKTSQPEPDYNTNQSYITLWTNQFATADDIGVYLDKITSFGYDGIDLCILWGDFAYDRAAFDWTFVDSALDIISGRGFKTGISIVLWTNNLVWKDTLSFQQKPDGNIYEYSENVKSFINLNDPANISAAEEAIIGLASHCNEKYGDKIQRWGIRVSDNGKMEYSTTSELDFSDSSVKAFSDYLKNKYSDLSEFNQLYDKTFESWDSVTEDRENLPLLFRYDWKIFKQNTILNFIKISSDIFKTVNPSIPVCFYTSGFTSSSSALYSGLFDPFIAAENSGAQIINVTADIKEPGRNKFIFDLLDSTTGIVCGGEIDGGWTGAETVAGYPEIIKILASSGAKTVSFTNWNTTDIDEYHDAFSQYAEQFKNVEEREDAVPDDIIVINTLDFILRSMPTDLYSLYKLAYSNMSGETFKKVLIYTDTQIMKNPELLDNVKIVHTGILSQKVFIYPEYARILADKNIRISDADGAQPEFVDQYGLSIDGSLQGTLNSKIKEG